MCMSSNSVCVCHQIAGVYVIRQCVCMSSDSVCISSVVDISMPILLCVCHIDMHYGYMLSFLYKYVDMPYVRHTHTQRNTNVLNLVASLTSYGSQIYLIPMACFFNYGDMHN